MQQLKPKLWSDISDQMLPFLLCSKCLLDYALPQLVGEMDYRVNILQAAFALISFHKKYKPKL